MAKKKKASKTVKKAAKKSSAKKKSGMKASGKGMTIYEKLMAKCPCGSGKTALKCCFKNPKAHGFK